MIWTVKDTPAEAKSRPPARSRLTDQNDRIRIDHDLKTGKVSRKSPVGAYAHGDRD